ALTRLACRGLHHDDAFLDLGDLRLEETREIAGMGPRQRDLRSLGAAPHLEDERANAIARVVALPGNLLAVGQDRLGLADLQDDVALLDAVDHPAEDLAFLAGELRVDPLALGVPHLLEDHLLGGLGGDAAQILERLVLQELELHVQLGLRRQRLGIGQADLELGIGDLLDHPLAVIDTELAGLPIDVDTDVLARAERLSRSRQQGRLQRLEEDLFIDPLLPAQLIDHDDQFSVHDSAARRGHGTSASRRALVTRSRGSSTRSPSRSSVSRASSTSASRPRNSWPPASQHCTRLPSAQRNSRSFRSWRSSPGDDTSRSYASSIRSAASRTSPTSRLRRRQSSMPTPPGLSTASLRTPRGRCARHSRSTSVTP